MSRVYISKDNLSVNRVEEKCINCGICLKTCKSINGDILECINCGQCILTCPTGSLTPKYDYKKVLNYIKDTNKVVIAFTSPAVRVAIGDEFGFEKGAFLEGKLVSALKSIGFDYVLDTNFGADITIMEEAYELVDRINNNNLPMFTSCCPSWVTYLSKYKSNDKKYLSTCKSPIAMEATMIKSYFASMKNICEDDIICIAITPCVSKKTEIIRYPETDMVITTRELSMMIRELGIDFKNLKDKKYDELMGKSSGAGLIFGVSGGVTEAILRTAYYMLNRKKAPDYFYKLNEVRGKVGFKSAILDMGTFKIKVAVINELSNFNKYYDELKNYDFIEVMACPGGCIGGGGHH